MSQDFMTRVQVGICLIIYSPQININNEFCVLSTPRSMGTWHSLSKNRVQMYMTGVLNESKYMSPSQGLRQSR